MNSYDRVREKLRKYRLDLPALDQLPHEMHSYQLMFNYNIEGYEARKLVDLLITARAIKAQLELEDPAVYAISMKTVQSVEKLLMRFFGGELPTFILFTDILAEIGKTGLVSPRLLFAYHQDVSEAVLMVGTKNYPEKLQLLCATAHSCLELYTEEEIDARSGDIRGAAARLDVYMLLRGITLQEES